MLVAEEAVETRVLKRQGKRTREIAWMLDESRNMVRRYLRGEGCRATGAKRDRASSTLQALRRMCHRDHYRENIATTMSCNTIRHYVTSFAC